MSLGLLGRQAGCRWRHPTQQASLREVLFGFFFFNYFCGCIIPRTKQHGRLFSHESKWMKWSYINNTEGCGSEWCLIDNQTSLIAFFLPSNESKIIFGLHWRSMKKSDLLFDLSVHKAIQQQWFKHSSREHSCPTLYHNIATYCGRQNYPRLGLNFLSRREKLMDTQIKMYWIIEQRSLLLHDIGWSMKILWTLKRLHNWVSSFY
jgi:hypothetical protein